jgi:hypothetical protein
MMLKYFLTILVAVLALAMVPLTIIAFSGPGALAQTPGPSAGAACVENWDDIGDDEDDPGEVDDADCDANGQPIRDDDDDDDNDSDDVPLSGSAYDRATRAALAHTGGGTVTETEAGDDGAAYEVEIRLPNGREVEINLDADFRVISQEDDD